MNKLVAAFGKTESKPHMHTQISVPTKFNLYIPDLDNHILVENNAGDVVISATRDNFSENRKMFFIRHLSAEGYIPDRYKWFTEPAESGFFGVKWIVAAPSHKRKAGPGFFRKLCTRRNALFGFLLVVWLLCFVWAARHTCHGL
jgi:hypothetical protein